WQLSLGPQKQTCCCITFFLNKHAETTDHNFHDRADSKVFGGMKKRKLPTAAAAGSESHSPGTVEPACKRQRQQQQSEDDADCLVADIAQEERVNEQWISFERLMSVFVH